MDQTISPSLLILVRGTGDVGSAVAHVLFQAGYRIVMHDDPKSTATRRGMAFADALFDGQTELAGVRAIHVGEAAQVLALLQDKCAIPVVAGDLQAWLSILSVTVLVDARMRKRSMPEDQRGLARLVIGLGPNFVARGNVDVAVETKWGDDLGKPIYNGPTLPLEGEPRPIAGIGRERYVYAPRAGILRAYKQIGSLVQAGDTVASIDDLPLLAPVAGMLRGITHDGVAVTTGTKIIEVDPSFGAASTPGLGKRPAKIAEGVKAVIIGFEVDSAAAELLDE